MYKHGHGVVLPHARKRMRQRGVRRAGLDLVLEYGCQFHAGGGRTAHWLHRRSVLRARLLHSLRLDHLTNVACIVDVDGSIVTTYRKAKRPQHWRPVAFEGRPVRGCSGKRPGRSAVRSALRRDLNEWEACRRASDAYRNGGFSFGRSLVPACIDDLAVEGGGL